MKNAILLGGGAVALLASLGAQSKAPEPDPFATAGLPLVKKYCYSCHGDAKASMAGIYLGDLKRAGDLRAKSALTTKVLKAIESGHMPPSHVTQPSKAERTNLIDAIAKSVATDCDLTEPGKVTMRRLNKVEYNNTIRDLFGFDFKPADRFPSDDVGYGFDNIGDVLSVSPLHVEQYLAAAEEVARRAILVHEVKVRQFEAAELKSIGGTSPVAEGINYFTNAKGTLKLEFPRAGRYRISVTARGQLAGPELPRMTVSLEGQSPQTVDVPGKAVKFDFPFDIAGAGPKTLTIAYINDYYQPTENDASKRDRNLIVMRIDQVGPLDPPTQMPASHRQILFARPNATNQDAVANQIISAFARRAFRRPPTDTEVARLTDIAGLAYKNGESFERGIQLAITACLVSPNFIYRIEENTTQTRPLNGYEMATRLSYFLWSSCPDEELLTLAAAGKLNDDATLLAQTRRMIADPRSRALAENFAGQWLQLRSLDVVQPSQEMFQRYTPSLRQAMRDETELYFDGILRENRSILEFIDSNYTYVNQELAAHYGLPPVSGPAMQRVTLADKNRGGVLTQGSFLTVTSNPTRTSPVKRGKFIMENILGTPPPPPPPAVDALSEDKAKIAGLTMRQRMVAHRKNPTCNSCHSKMDPLGLSLENFSAIGQWRTKDDGNAVVDASGDLPTGEKFDGPSGLKRVLMERKDDFTRSLADRLLTYATGRGMKLEDRCHIDEIIKQAKTNGLKFQSLIESVVLSAPMRNAGPAPRPPVTPTKK
ncbi:MAG: DUF1592 domain-containing protein [Chthonomonas sp.]|nr:DUF1592 domain-containing protein [Chthonomonas sp.]